MVEILLTMEIVKQIEALPKKDKEAISTLIRKISKGNLKLLQKLQGKELFIARSRTYRIVFSVIKKTLYIIAIFHRGQVYKQIHKL